MLGKILFAVLLSSVMGQAYAETDYWIICDSCHSDYDFEVEVVSQFSGPGLYDAYVANPNTNEVREVVAEFYPDGGFSFSILSDTRQSSDFEQQFGVIVGMAADQIIVQAPADPNFADSYGSFSGRAMEVVSNYLWTQMSANHPGWQNTFIAGATLKEGLNKSRPMRG